MVVAGIGQCAWDMLAVVDRFPRADTKKEVLVWEEQGGGPVATALAALSRLGITCRLYGVIGDDREGDAIRQSLIGEGVDVTGLVKRLNASSQTSFIAIDKSQGTRTIFWGCGRRISRRFCLRSSSKMAARRHDPVCVGCCCNEVQKGRGTGWHPKAFGSAAVSSRAGARP